MDIKMIYLSFKLSMPGVPAQHSSWLRKEPYHDVHYIIKSFKDKEFVKINEVLKGNNYFSYGWPDGWRASVSLEIIDRKEATKRKKQSSDFCGYDWMVTSILEKGKIEC